MERYVLFGDLNTYADCGFILQEKTINPPEPKTNYVEIDGADGAIDLTEALSGEIRYRNRTATFVFWTDEGSYEDRVNVVRTFRRTVHGKKMHIVEPDDPNTYMIGRVIITEEFHDLAYSTVTIECICDPFRMSNEIKSQTITLTKSASNIPVEIINTGDKTIAPIIEVLSVHNPVRIVQDGMTVAVISEEESTVKVNAVKIKPGTNIIIINTYMGSLSSVPVKITTQEAYL